jgi:cobalt/nickel transport system permease protein
MALEFLDRYSRGTSIMHRWPAWFKMCLAISLITSGLFIRGDAWPLHGLLLCIVFAGLSIAGIPMSYLWHRLLGFWLFALLLTISIPAGQVFRAGWDLAVTILLQSTLGFLTGLWLVNVTPFDKLLHTLRRCGVPKLLIAILAFMYRYSYVVFDELQRMRTARNARNFGNSSWRSDWKSNAQMIGMLLVRSLSRAERVHGAMCARGWSGDIHLLEDVSKSPPQ